MRAGVRLQLPGSNLERQPAPSVVHSASNTRLMPLADLLDDEVIELAPHPHRLLARWALDLRERLQGRHVNLRAAGRALAKVGLFGDHDDWDVLHNLCRRPSQCCTGYKKLTFLTLHCDF